MTEGQLEQLVDNLRGFEGASSHMYLDTADPPRVTVGIGVMLPDAAAACALPFQCTGAGRGATPNEVTAAFERVQRMRGGMALAYYQGVTDVELPADEVARLAEQRLTGVFLPGLVKLLPGWGFLPWPVQQVMVDLAWNVGTKGLGTFRKLLAAVQAGDWETAARESHVSTSRPARNDWRAQTLRSAADVA